MSPIEILGVLVSATAIALTAKRKMACWPVGLLSVALYAYIFYDARLYSDMLLQGAFAVMQVYGWRHWLRGRTSPGLPDAGSEGTSGVGADAPVQAASWRMLVPGVIAGAVGSVLLGAVMDGFTDATLPWIDAALSGFSLVAQYWTARKYLASWVLWIVVDCIYVGMFVMKDLYPTAVLYAFFVFLAVAGWREWRAHLSKNARDDWFNEARIPPLDVAATALAVPPRAGAAAAIGQFGVHGHQTERDWPLMIESEVASVLASYPVDGEIDQLSWHSPRQFAAAVLVRMTTGRVLFVKRHHVRVRDVEALSEEHRFILHLASRGIAVADVLSDRLERTAIRIDEWVYEVHAKAEGVDLYRQAMSWEPFVAVSHAYAAGCALARLHQAAADYEAPARGARLLLSSFNVIGAEHWLEAASAWIDAQPLLAAALAERPWRTDLADTLGPYHAALAPMLSSLTPLWTHGDWHASNLLWSAHGEDAYVQSVLDFGLSDRTCAIYDLALAIERNTIEWLDTSPERTVHIDQIDALLDGYASVIPLSARDYRVLIALLPIVHVEFALSEVAYFEGILQAYGDAETAYTDYLLGHTRWFSQTPGRALLTHLAQRRDALHGRV